MLRWLICRTCNKEKHDTAFEIKDWFDLDLEKCLDCKYPDRWDEARMNFGKLLNRNICVNNKFMKAWELKKGDKARHWKEWELLTFNKMDWMYALWHTEKWKLKVGHTDKYELQEDGTYLW